MSEARSIASQLLSKFIENVEAGKVRSYSYYAHAIGRDPGKEAIVIGPAMHAIGAACVFRQIPVAPLHYVTRSDGKRPEVFCSDPLENLEISKHLPTLKLSARVYSYSISDFEKVDRILSELPPNWSPHFMWHYALVAKAEGENQTYFERALAKYEAIVEEARIAR